jgi:hypothetical protein
MTKHLVSILIVAALPLLAQDGHTLRVSIPFNFTAGAKTFEAGDYAVTKSPGTGVITLRSDDRKSAAMFLTRQLDSSSVSATGRLTFHRSGEQYFLAEIWEPGSNSGSAIPVSKAERELRTRSGIPARVQVSVALR